MALIAAFLSALLSIARSSFNLVLQMFFSKTDEEMSKCCQSVDLIGDASQPFTNRGCRLLLFC
jgi:hypothetical protein